MFHIRFTPTFMGLGFIIDCVDHLYGIHVLWFSAVYHHGCKGEGEDNESSTTRAE